MSEKIDLNQEKLEMFYEQFGSKNLRLQSEMAKDHGKKSLDLYYKSIDFLYKTITTIGIIAGFGFTGLNYVRSYLLFFIGEALFFSAIAVGIWAIQKIYLDERKNFNSFYSQIKTHFKEWYVLFKPILDKAVKNDLEREDMQKLQNKEKELLSILTDSPEVEKDRKEILPIIIWIIFYLFITGAAFLFSSFIFYKL
ncbi:hypothetical protein COY96_02145 [Candidatus Wolfebacteria bacterium CG_4_10_14_0_8_um_filter_37_11]|uniref:Uncharacterized protein n=2 Tax=Candidatus Wolfeibacteriota TaxID=1752735 RepID=A0A2M7Q8U6_9BACT|nr:MAG: hypothetical protein COY96_02145 [Candidatus Wolfebacteria bacterium CG_4_10_14_0_8_um_filter_37_11]PJA41774.1 MAG: hypothetical protein CO177_00695 [Candidatus Wolfebacteria bacterium CG_4_9_14_3_um_filter_37_9]